MPLQSSKGIEPKGGGQLTKVYNSANLGLTVGATAAAGVAYVNVEVVAVAGGGGGGQLSQTPQKATGGGGAGGLRNVSTLVIANVSYPITIGAGGAYNASGEDTVVAFQPAPLTVKGGGKGGTGDGGTPTSPTTSAGTPGGSGGGAGSRGYPSPDPNSPWPGGSAEDYPGPVQQGYPGGNASWGPGGAGNNGAGGGGAGSHGEPSTSGKGGGTGKHMGQFTPIWSPGIPASYGTGPSPTIRYFGGGGGGGRNGQGGEGGGGNGGNPPNTVGTAGVVNTGGGGGGGAAYGPGQGGGSGIVMIRNNALYGSATNNATASSTPGDGYIYYIFTADGTISFSSSA